MWHSPVWSRRLAARPAHNGPAIASLTPLVRRQWKPTAMQAPSSESSQSTGQAQAPTPAPGIRIQNRTWPGGPKSRPWFFQKICQTGTKATGLSFADPGPGKREPPLGAARNSGKNPRRGTRKPELCLCSVSFSASQRGRRALSISLA